MIDLTRVDSPLGSNEIPHSHEAIEKAIDPVHDIPDVSPDSPKITQSKATAGSRHSVTFAPIVDRSPSPTSYHQNQSVFISRAETKRCKINAIHLGFL